jgi:type IV secretion system protein VirD4
VPTADASESSDGGLQQACAPKLPSPCPVRPEAPEPFDPLGLGDDDDVGAAAALAMRPLSPIVAAHAVNEASGRDDLMPNF